MASEIDAAELARLREIAEVARKEAPPSWEFRDAFDPPAILALIDALEKARRQLPEGMEHCTIVFEECPKGHGNLRGANWIKHPCVICERDSARSEGKPMLSDESAAQVMWANLCCVRPVGCGDGDTYFVQAPTQAEFVAVVYPALATVRAEATLAGAAAEREAWELRAGICYSGADIAAKDREIAALREALAPFVKLAPAFMGVHEGYYINVGTRNQLPLRVFVDAVAAFCTGLPASPAPDPANVPPWERKAPCPCGAPIGAGCIREKESGFIGCWILGGPMPPSPDPAEAMRAKCEVTPEMVDAALSHWLSEWGKDDYSSQDKYDAKRAIEAALRAALKGNGEGL